MSTCPYCHRRFEKEHACRGRWPERARTILAGATGGTVGFFMAFLIPTDSSGGVAVVTAILGAVLGISAWRSGRV